MKLNTEIFALVIVVLILGAASGGTPAMASSETFIYDDAGRLIQATTDDGQTMDYFYDEAGNLVREVRQGSRNAVTMCGDLSHPKKDGFPDRDDYAFTGRAGELVTVSITADPPENGMGLKAALTLKDRTPRQSQKVSDMSVLPNVVSMVLEMDGVYEIEIHGQKEIFRELRYSGPYCVTLEAAPEAAASFTGPVSE